MADVFIYFVKLPKGIDEAVMSGVDHFTIYIDERLSDAQKKEAYDHAMRHINKGHFDYNCELTVQEMECEAHMKGV